MGRLLALLFVVFVFRPPAEGQALFSPRLPEQLQDHPRYQLLIALREICRSAIPAELDRLRSSASSANTKFYLEQAVRELPQARQPRLAESLARLNRHTRIVGVDTLRLLALEAELVSVNGELDAWEDVYRFSGENMRDYRPDTALAALKAEIGFYGLRPGEHIAEIGAGQERFAAAVAATAGGMTYYLNELDTMALMRIAYHLGYNPAFRGRENRFFAVRGSAFSCGLEGATLDKVIIRNAFHHFDHPAEMLASVKASITPQGALYLKEMYREDCPNDCCERLLEKQVILDTLAAAGFEPAAEQMLTDEDGLTWWLLKFVRKENRN